MTRRDLLIWTLGLLFLCVELAALLFLVFEGRLLLDICIHILGVNGQELRCP